MLYPKKQTCYIGDRLHLVVVEDGEERTLMGHKTTFFDIQSTKAKQFGFCMDMGNGEKFTCCGDEPYNECEKKYAENSKWLLHEAFCLFDQADRFHPYEKHHSTAKDASELAEQLGVQNLILYHTEDKNIARRKELYTEEGKKYFHGNLFVPEDLEESSCNRHNTSSYRYCKFSCAVGRFYLFPPPQILHFSLIYGMV